MKKTMMVPKFEIERVPGVAFGGFAIANHMAAREDKLPWRYVTLPQAMIAAADQGPGMHLLTAFEWASMAYYWAKAEKLDDVPFDMHAETWQWVMGLFMDDKGEPDILATLDVTRSKSPYGRGIFIPGNEGEAPQIVCDGTRGGWAKSWDPNLFDQMKVYVAEAADQSGKFFKIERNTQDRLVLEVDSGMRKGKATFCIVRHIDKSIVSGHESGQYISSLHDTDPDLAAFAIPRKTSSVASPNYGNDRYWFYHGRGLRAAFRGGDFSNGASAGVFALYLLPAPSNASYAVGFRASKAL